MCGKSPEKKKKNVTNKQTNKHRRHTFTVNMRNLDIILYDIHVTKKPKICDKLNIALFTCKLLLTFAC